MNAEATLTDRIFASARDARVGAEAQGWTLDPVNWRRAHHGVVTIELAEWQGSWAWSEGRDG